MWSYEGKYFDIRGFIFNALVLGLSLALPLGYIDRDDDNIGCDYGRGGG